ncbi:MAG: co-chaperone GroES [Candidatus Babeliaceae bacterium]
MIEKIRPLDDRILVQLLENQEEKTAGGLFIPDTARERKAQMGKVIAVGAGRVTPEGKVLPLAVKIDDVVLFGKYSGTETDQKDLMFVRSDDILGIVEK